MYNQIDSNKRKTNILFLIFFSLIIGIAIFMNAYGGYDYSIVVIAFVISFFMTWLSYYHSDKIALRSTGAKEITKADNKYVYNMVENLCITAGIPTPKVHIIDTPAMNAFATGRDPEHASIALTSGIIDALENEELEGVIAHELSHIKNYDIRVMTVVIVLVGTLSLMADMFFRVRLFGGSRNSDKGGNGIMLIISIALIIISPIVAELIKLAISRKREFLADASASLMTRYPEGLASALEKISASNIPMEKASTATAHLFISNPFKGKKAKSWFSTHPPIEERISELRGMTR